MNNSLCWCNVVLCSCCMVWPFNINMMVIVNNCTECDVLSSTLIIVFVLFSLKQDITGTHLIGCQVFNFLESRSFHSMRLWSRPPLCTVTLVPSTPTIIPAASTLKATSLRRLRISMQTTTCRRHLCQSTTHCGTRAKIWTRPQPVQALLGSASARPCPSSTALTSTCHSTPTQATQVTPRGRALLPPQPRPPRLLPWAPVATEGATL